MKKTNRKKMALVGFVLAIWLLMLQSSFVQAQFKSLPNGKFEVDQIRGCPNLTVTVNNLVAGDCNPSLTPCDINYGDGSLSTQSVFNHTYTSPGTYTLKVLYGGSSGSQQFENITITIDPDTKPDFDIYTCSGSKVFIKITDKTYDQYLIDFNSDGIVDKPVPSGNNVVAQFDYVTPGNYNISVKGKKNNSAPNCSPMVKPFTALTPLPVAQIKTLTALDNTSLKLDFTPVTNIQYKLEIAVNGATTFQQYQTLYGVNTFTATNLDLNKNYYCFRLSAYDACSGINNYSSTVCSQIPSLNIQSAINKLTWVSDVTGVLGVDIYRNKSLIGKAGVAQFYDDVDVDCNKNYCYSIVVNYASGAKSSSLEVCGKSFTKVTPNPILDVSAVTNAQSLDVIWIPDPLQNSTLWPNNNSVLKSVGKGPYSSIALVPGTALSITAKNPITYSDLSYTPQGNTCYRINYTDACGNQSLDGEETCPIFLQGTMDKKNVITLNWNEYGGWQNGVKNYKLEKFSTTGGLISTVTLTSTTYEDSSPDLIYQVVSYKVTAIPNGVGLTQSTSNSVTFVKETNLFYPNAFSPNDDNLNDTFNVSGQYISKLKLSVFDRWGGLLFVSEKNEPWNGYANGKLLNEGAYVWKAEVTDFTGRIVNHTGTIFLITRQK